MVKFLILVNLEAFFLCLLFLFKVSMLRRETISPNLVDSQHQHQKITQNVYNILDFSSQYGREGSKSYSVINLISGSSVYPNYGDFMESCVLVRFFFSSLYFPIEQPLRIIGNVYFKLNYVNLSSIKKKRHKNLKNMEGFSCFLYFRCLKLKRSFKSESLF